MSHRYGKSKPYYYADRLLRLDCYEYLYSLFNKASSPVKEMTEVYGIYNHLKDKFDTKDTNVCVYELGAGVTPRLSGLLVHLTKWTCYSVDPRSYNSGTISNFNRLICYKEKAEDLTIELVNDSISSDLVDGLIESKVLPISPNNELIIVFPHAHLDTNLFIGKVKSLLEHTSIYVIVLPCCFPSIQLLSNKDSLEDYEDEYILGDKNRIVTYIT